MDRTTLELAASLLLFGDRELTEGERARLLAAAGVRDSGGRALRRGLAAEARAAIVRALPSVLRKCDDADPVPLSLVRELLDRPPDRLPGAHPLVVRAPDGSTLFQQSAESVPAVGDAWVEHGSCDRFGREHPRRVWRVVRRTWSHVAVTALCVRLDVVPLRRPAGDRFAAWCRARWARAVAWVELARL